MIGTSRTYAYSDNLQAPVCFQASPVILIGKSKRFHARIGEKSTRRSSRHFSYFLPLLFASATIRQHPLPRTIHLFFPILPVHFFGNRLSSDNELPLLLSELLPFAFYQPPMNVFLRFGLSLDRDDDMLNVVDQTDLLYVRTYILEISQVALPIFFFFFLFYYFSSLILLFSPFIFPFFN